MDMDMPSMPSASAGAVAPIPKPTPTMSLPTLPPQASQPMPASKGYSAFPPLTTTLHHTPSDPGLLDEDDDCYYLEDGDEDDAYAFGVPEVDRRDRRIQRWLEQQCRLSMVLGEGGRKGKGRVTLEEGDRGGQGGREGRQGGLSLRHRASQRTMATVHTSAAVSPLGSALGSGSAEDVIGLAYRQQDDASRADSPLLGFPSAESLLLEGGGGGAGVLVDPLRHPGRNWVRELPDGEGEEAEEGESIVNVVVGRDKPLPTLPPPSPSASPPIPPSSAPAPPSSVLASAPAPELSTSSTSTTPSSCFTVPSAVASMSNPSLGLLTTTMTTASTGARHAQAQAQPYLAKLAAGHGHSPASSHSSSSGSHSHSGHSGQSGHSHSHSHSSMRLSYSQLAIGPGMGYAPHAHARTPSTLSVASSVMHSHHGHSHGHQGHGHTLSQSQSLAYSPASASYAALPSSSSSGGNANGSAPPSRRTSQQNLGLGLGVGVGVSVSRRPSLLKMPSLPLLGETSVLGEDLDLDLGLARMGISTATAEEVGFDGIDGLPSEIRPPPPPATAPAAMSVSVSDSAVLVQSHGGLFDASIGTASSAHTDARPFLRTRFRSQSSASIHPASGSGTSLTAPGGVQQQPMYHLPTSMQVRRSQSQLQLGLGTSQDVGMLLHPLSQGQSQGQGQVTQPSSPAMQASPLPPSAPPTRRQSRAAFAALALPSAPGSGTSASAGHAQNLSVSSSSASRSRAGSVSAAQSLGASMNGSTLSLSSGASGAHPGMRHAVYIDSEEVRERLDALLLRGGAEIDGGDGVDGGDDGDDGLERTGDEDGDEYTLEAGDVDDTFILHTPPPSAFAPSFPFGVHATPTTTAVARGQVQVPPNTPMTPYQQRQQQQQYQQHSQQQYHANHPYQNAQASSSQVYVGPGAEPVHSRDASSSSRGSKPAPHAPAPLSRSHSLLSGGGGVHSRAVSKESSAASLSLSLSQTQAQAQAHAQTQERASSAHSRSPSSVLQLQLQQPATPPSAIARPMSIPVPIQMPLPVAGTRPTRPPPAPPLDLGMGVAGIARGETDVAMLEEGLGLEDEVDGGFVENVEVEGLVGGEGEGITHEEEIERLQLLRGLKLEDRMEEFRGVEFPSGLDDEPYGYGSAPLEQAERPPMMRSMSRWSMTSSTMEEPVGGKKDKDKERKRKSFASPFSLGGGEAGGVQDRAEDRDSMILAPAGPTASPTTTMTGKDKDGKEKKRGRLASFISRLSGVGVGSPTAAAGVPPLPSTPAVPSGLLPSPVIVDSGPRRAKSRDNEMEGAEVVDVEVAGAVRGVWDPQPSSSNGKALASKSIPSSPKITRLRSPTVPLPLGKAYSEGAMAFGAGSTIVNAHTRMDAGMQPEMGWERAETLPLGMRGRSNSAADLLMLSSASGSGSDSTNDSFVNVHAPAGFNANGTRRPVLHKSASASVLGPLGMKTPLSQTQIRRTPMHIQTQMSTHYRGPSFAVDDSFPPTPSSIASTDIEEEDEEENEEEDYGVEDRDMERIRRERAHEERWARVRMDAEAEMYAKQQTLSLQPSTTVIKVENALMALSPPTHAPLAQAQGLESALEQRQRLKTMSSLGNLRPSAPASPPASASTSNFAPPLPSAKSGKGSGFRGFVERMGLVGSSSNNNSGNNSPLSSYPTTPLSAGPLSLSIPSSSANSSAGVLPPPPTPLGMSHSNRSPSHSPTASLSLSGTHRDSGGVFTPGGLLGKKKQPKRKLVISGVGPEDVRGYEAVKSWCEAFGEVREMRRAPNGSLYVDFRKASVAETVCRVQAQVYIKGAGSVLLSWYTKKKPL